MMSSFSFSVSSILVESGFCLLACVFPFIGNRLPSNIAFGNTPCERRNLNLLTKIHGILC